MSIDLRLGDWRKVLADVEHVDALITDPPYGARTHASLSRIKSGDGAVRRTSMGYGHFTEEDVAEFCSAWSSRVRGWFCAMSSHDLMPCWERELSAAGRYVFAPLACVQRGRGVRLVGDGPANWTDWLIVARPRSQEFSNWGALPGAYLSHGMYNSGSNTGIMGGKPLPLMSAIVRDYSRSGDLVCDPCAGMATTGVVCESLGRRFVGAEIDPDTHAKALERIRKGVQIDLFGGAA